MNNFDSLTKSKLKKWVFDKQRKGELGSDTFSLYGFVAEVFDFGSDRDLLDGVKLGDCNRGKSRNKVSMCDTEAQEVEGM